MSNRMNDIWKGLSDWIGDLADMVYPPVCEVCGCRLVKGEKTVCLECLASMPRVDAHIDPENELARRLAAAGKIFRVAAMFRYVRDNDYARLIQKSKYNGRPDIDHALAVAFASELHRTGFFDGMDLILPVPMHHMKKLRRGYNQAEEIAAGVSSVTGIRVADNLVAKRAHDTQTRKNAAQRMKNTAGIYDVVYAEELDGRHILIVDDVITTGATVLACAEAIRKKAPAARVSVLALAATHFLQ